MPGVQLDAQTILLVVAVVLLLAQTVTTLNKGKKDFRELTGADRRSTEIAEIKKRLDTLESDMGKVEARLTQGESNFSMIRKDTGQIMDVLDGLLLHFISGNDREKLKSVKQELDHYKNTR